MSATKAIVYVFAVLVPLTLVFCQETQDSASPSLPSIPGIPSFPGVPNIPGVPHLPGLPGSQGSPDSDGPQRAHDEDHNHQDRFFFSLFTQVTGCNFTAEPGRTCRSCTQALTCLPNNVGLTRRCHGLFRYCSEGRCSLFQGSACSATTTASTSTTSSSSSSSSTSTTTQATGGK